MLVTVAVYHKGECIELQGEEGSSLKKLLLDNGFMMAFPCGGCKKCGRCRIAANTEASEEEKKILSVKELQQGIRLACCTTLAPGLCVTISDQTEMLVLTSMANQKYEYAPTLHEVALEVPAPALNDQRSDLRRVMDACHARQNKLNFAHMALLSQLVHQKKEIVAVMHDGALIGCGERRLDHALCIDIGTTTLAANLLDLNSGKVVAVQGEANAQSAYGADVISRIKADMTWRQQGGTGQSPLQKAIVDQINRILESFLKERQLPDVLAVSIAGNTTMMHLLCGLPAEHIGKAPFTPVFLDGQLRNARDIGLHSDAALFLMPSLSSYVGADIVAALLAAEGWKEQPPFLLVDLGTNAETILGVNGTLYACSAAAGPCFEGVSLECGMPGQPGAIDAVRYDDKQGFRWSTIGNVPAKGLCGSGIISVISLLLQQEVMDMSGRLEEDDSPLGRRVHDGAFYITDHIFVSQKDIRAIQMAKAAVRAGMDILLNTAGLEEEQLERIYLAGGFGSAMNAHDAGNIGLIPEHLADKSVALGNAAAFGAIRYITEKNIREHVKKIQQHTKYIELSCDPRFSNSYVERMFFGDL